ncbi:MAG: ribosome silencing factor [Candidatus Omnitrophica bacterium CG11_big_fil_rev_8_21_14_0_20_64_10]|nr:MAG: ribosome silencing factor [Candidatus Omnitrophica bacterium CG11_big_fil_rev_8_21_14_0_20_64_10]
MVSRSTRQAALAAAAAARDARAEEIVVLDLRKLSFSFDFFVICSATSARRLQTIADDIQEALSRKSGAARCEGDPAGGWVLVDAGSVVAHVLSTEARGFYGLERLWADAPRLPVPGGVSEPAASSRR